MNIHQQGFKGDILSTIFKVAGKTWLKITGVYAIRSIVIAILAVIMFLVFLSSYFDLADFAQFSNLSEPQEIIRLFSGLFEDLSFTPTLIGGLVLFILILMIVGAWSINVQTLMTDSYIKTDGIDFGAIFQKSFNNDVVRILGAFILIYVITILLFVIAGFSASISGLLAFILFLGVSLVIFKFILIIPAMIIGKMTLPDAFAWSLQHITWLRSLKILGIGVLAGLTIAIAAVIVGLLSAVFAFIPVIGIIIQQVINILFGGFMTAVSVATFVGLYYRYAEDLPEGKDNIEINDMLVE